MKQNGKSSAKRPLETRTGKLAEAIGKGLNRMFEWLGPQPQLRPVPARVRSGSRGRRIA